MISKIKKNIKYIISIMVNYFILPSKEIKKNSLLIVRIDAIGDYILFRNFIKELKNAYKNYDITLLGNVAYRDLAQELDALNIKKFIWIHRDKFAKRPLYRYYKLREITSCGYEIVINPSYSRDFVDSDNIVKLLSSSKKIAIVSDLSNKSIYYQQKSDLYYDKLINTQDGVLFEYHRNRIFFEKLLGIKLTKTKLHIELKSNTIEYLPSTPYVVISIGAGADFRKWDVKNYAKIAKYIKSKYNYNIVLCGLKDDIKQVKKFELYFQDVYMDLVGKTSLVEFLYILKNASLVVSNESSTVHMAIALGDIKTIVISNANHLGRFTPYPKDITTDCYEVYHPSIDADIDDFVKFYKNGSSLNIDDITFNMVKDKVDEVYNKISRVKSENS
jgi:ADP-heptose:LPS heptosyltransferase